MSDNTLVLPFLEQRSYLHGTTLYQHLRPMAPATVGTCFRIARVIRSNVIRLVKGDVAIEPVARIDWTENGIARTLAVEELPPCSPIHRCPYDESLVSSSMIVEDYVAYLSDPLPFDTISTAVPLFKETLRINGFAPVDGGQWMFTRLDSHPIEGNTENQSMKLQLQLVRPRLIAKASVFLAVSKWADMYFSWVPSS